MRLFFTKLALLPGIAAGCTLHTQGYRVEPSRADRIARGVRQLRFDVLMRAFPFVQDCGRQFSEAWPVIRSLFRRS